jgi:hypothetical protein
VTMMEPLLRALACRVADGTMMPRDDNNKPPPPASQATAQGGGARVLEHWTTARRLIGTRRMARDDKQWAGMTNNGQGGRTMGREDEQWAGMTDNRQG